jgi:hypothetical protein
LVIGEANRQITSFDLLRKDILFVQEENNSAIDKPFAIADFLPKKKYQQQNNC